MVWMGFSFQWVLFFSSEYCLSIIFGGQLVWNSLVVGIQIFLICDFFWINYFQYRYSLFIYSCDILFLVLDFIFCYELVDYSYFFLGFILICGFQLGDFFFCFNMGFGVFWVYSKQFCIVFLFSSLVGIGQSVGKVEVVFLVCDGGSQVDKLVVMYSKRRQRDVQVFWELEEER